MVGDRGDVVDEQCGSGRRLMEVGYQWRMDAFKEFEVLNVNQSTEYGVLCASG